MKSTSTLRFPEKMSLRSLPSQRNSALVIQLVCPVAIQGWNALPSYAAYGLEVNFLLLEPAKGSGARAQGSVNQDIPWVSDLTFGVAES